MILTYELFEKRKYAESQTNARLSINYFNGLSITGFSALIGVKTLLVRIY